MLKKTISRTVIIDRDANVLHLAKGYDHGGFRDINNLEDDVTGPLPKCKKYRVDYTLNPFGKFRIMNEHFIARVDTPEKKRNACFTEPFGWNGKRFDRVVRVLEW